MWLHIITTEISPIYSYHSHGSFLANSSRDPPPIFFWAKMCHGYWANQPVICCTGLDFPFNPRVKGSLYLHPSQTCHNKDVRHLTKCQHGQLLSLSSSHHWFNQPTSFASTLRVYPGCVLLASDSGSDISLRFRF